MNPTGPSYPLASLYVGDLHPDVSEAMLFEKFSVCGPVLSIRVCRDMMTRRSLGYAYVNFQQPADAERALDSMNYDIVKGRPIRIMWSQRDPSLRRSGVGNIFIKNLDKSIDNKSMYDTFSAFGNILSCKVVATDETGSSRGYGFVHFETEEAAQNAIAKVNGMLLNGRKVYVGKFIPRAERERALGEHPRKFTNVFVKNFGDELDDDKLLAMFEPFGKVLSHKVMSDENGKSRGFGFVSFENPDDAEQAVMAKNGTPINNGSLYVGRAQKKAERQADLRRQFQAQRMERQNRYQGANLYVKNLDESVDDEALKKEFTPYGNITSAKVMRENGRSKGFGFVCFASPEEAQKAVNEMNGKIVAAKPLYVAMAQRKEDRRAQITNQMMQRFTVARYPGPGQVFQQAPPPFLYPTMAQTQRGYFPAAAAQLMRPQRWSPGQQMRGPQQGPQGQFQQMSGVPGGPFRSSAPRGQHFARPPNQMGPRPVAGQSMPGQPQQNQRMSGPPVMTQNVARPPQQVNGMPPTQLPNATQAGVATAIRTGGPGFIRPSGAPMGTRGPAPPAATPQTTSNSTIDPSQLAKATPHDQKQMLGEKLFPLVQKMYPDLAGKITGMLLEIDNSDLLLLLESNDSLKMKVDEAVKVLKSHMKPATEAKTETA